MFGRQSIVVLNTPQRSPSVPGVFTKTSFVMGLLDDGTVVSEVGDPVLVPTWFQPVAGFRLRKSRNTPRNRPFTPYGGFLIGNALCSPVVETVTLGAVGSRIVLEPKIPPLLANLLTQTQSSRANVTIIVRIPVPLGMSVLLRAYCPEIDAGTKTRGIIWKPGAAPTLAFEIGWDCDVPIVRGDIERKGLNGLTLAIETTEDNSVDNINSPYTALVWYYFHEVESFGWKNTSAATSAPKSWQFNEVEVPSTDPDPDAEEPSNPEVFWEQMMDDSNVEVTPGGLADAAEPGESLKGTPVMAEPVATEETAHVAPVAPAEHKPSKVMSQNASLNQKWSKLTTLTFQFATDVGTWKTVTVTPASNSARGENFALPWRRNVFCAPGRRGDTLCGMEFKIVSNRAPSFAGEIQIQTTSESRFSGGDIYWHTLGGEPTIFSDYPKAFVMNTGSSIDQKALVSPWRRCTTYSTAFNVRLAIVNYVQDRSSVGITIFTRPGSMRFNVPIKPRARPKTTASRLLDTSVTRAHIQKLASLLISAYQEEEVFEEQMLPDPATEGLTSEIAPSGSDGYAGLAQPLPVDAEDTGDLEQDVFWIRVGDIDLTEGTPKGITLELPSISDVNSAGGENPIAERFSRFVDITPTREGVYGPVIGKYVVKIRPPAGTTFDIEHVCLPPEINEEVATRLFGLDSLLSIAGSAINSVGGSLLGGALNTVGGLVGDVIGGPIGGVVSNVLGGILGGATNPQEDTTSVPTPAPEKDAQLISGDINFSRFLEFFKSFEGSEDNEDPWPTLLLKMVNLLTDSATRASTAIPATIYIRMDSAQCTRSAWERVVDSPDTRLARLYLPVDLEQFGLFLSYCSSSNRQQAPVLIRKMLTVLSTRRLDRSFKYDLALLNNEEEAEPSSLSLIFNRLSRLNLCE